MAHGTNPKIKRQAWQASWPGKHCTTSALLFLPGLPGLPAALAACSSFFRIRTKYFSTKRFSKFGKLYGRRDLNKNLGYNKIVKKTKKKTTKSNAVDK